MIMYTGLNLKRWKKNVVTVVGNRLLAVISHML